MSDSAKRHLIAECKKRDCRVQTMKLGNNIEYWVQSNYVGKDTGGHMTTERRTGSPWMTLGQGKSSSVCAHIVQVGWGFSRDEILTYAETFGEVVGFHLEIKVQSGKFAYAGT
eukprot:4947115-Karenia_brevis.AAC.1